MLREQKADESTYRYSYQGQFSEKDIETRWSHFELREFEPTIGRWTAVDPKRQYWSSYAGMGNNPVSGVDPDGGEGEIVPGANGKPIVAEIVNSKIVIKENGTEDLQKLVTDINESGSANAMEDFMAAVQSPGIVHIESDYVNTPPLYGYHQPHDENGVKLDWDKNTSTFNGTPATITAADGSLRYKEATVTLYLKNIYESSQVVLEATLKIQLEIKGQYVTHGEFVTDVFSHEMFHNLDQRSIRAGSRRDGNFNFEDPAYNREANTHRQIMQNRGN